MPLLEVENVSISFEQYEHKSMKREWVQPIEELTLYVDEGEFVAIVGASGSGKSLLAHAILGILPPNARVTGSIQFDGEELTAKRQAGLRGREISFVPQSVTFLDPLMRVGKQARPPESLTGRGKEARTRAAAAQRALFARYRLSQETEQLFPHQLSGGMARRILVTAAAGIETRLVVADEPTPGLDAEIVKEALGSFREMADQGCGVMLITHDLESVLTAADKVAVFYAGTTVELADANDFSGGGEQLRHPYSRALWQALPSNGFSPIPGSMPSPGEREAGCAFAPRCELATPECFEARPAMRELRGGKVRCHHAT